MRFQEYLIEQQATDKTTVHHEIGTAIFCVEPNAEIETGGDLREYIDEGVIEAARTTNDRDIAPIDNIDNELTENQLYLLSENVVTDEKVISDAKSLAKSLIEVTGEPQGTVYWTGPTNDISKYGAADIAYRAGGKFYPISLKFGSGQLKNMGLDALGNIVLSGILGENDSFSEVMFSRDNIEQWDKLVDGFIRYMKEFFNKIVADSGEERQIQSSLRKLEGIGWNKYQKVKLRQFDREVIELLKKYVNPYLFQDKDVDDVEEFSYIKHLFAKIYKHAGEFPDDKWKAMKSEVFEMIFGQYFKKIDNQDVIEENLAQFFKEQMSVGNYDMWYGAQGGKKILFIPNEESFDRLAQDFDYEIDAKATESGYKISLGVYAGKERVSLIEIDISLRWKGGQLVNKPATSSTISSEVDQEKWNSIFS